MGSNSWPVYVATVSVVTLITLYVLLRKKRQQTYTRVGRIAKLYFFPVKSLKGFEVTEGYCTKLGFKVNSLLDRSFMLIDDANNLLSQRQAPRLALLHTHVDGNILTISGPDVSNLKVEIKNAVSREDKIVDCKVHTDVVKGVDCGEEAASWFQAFVGLPGIRLVRYFETLPLRKYTKKDAFYSNLRKKNPAGFQDLAAFHLVTQASIDDLNSRIGDEKISVFNFRPNILADGCMPFEDDSWKSIKFDSGAELSNLILTTRCLLTTNDPETGILTQKEPLTTLRKYRIPKDSSMLKKTGALPCLGTAWGVLRSGEIKVGDDIYAVIGEQPSMQVK